MLRQLKSNLNLSIGFLNVSRIVVKFVKKTKEVEYEYTVLQKVFEGEGDSFEVRCVAVVFSLNSARCLV